MRARSPGLIVACLWAGILVLASVAEALDWSDLDGSSEWRQQAPEPTSAEIRRLGLDASDVERIGKATGSQAELYGNPPFAIAWRVSAPLANRLVAEERAGLHEREAILFVAERAYGVSLDRIALLHSEDPFGPVVHQQTSGPFRSTATIVAALEAWSKEADLYLFGAGADWVEVEFGSAPKNPESRLRAIAPQAVSEAALEELQRTNRILLWW